MNNEIKVVVCRSYGFHDLDSSYIVSFMKTAPPESSAINEIPNFTDQGRF